MNQAWHHIPRDPEVLAGEPVVILLKKYFYPEEKWSQVTTKLAAMLTKLKIEARKYYPELSEVSRLNKLATFSYEDARDALLIPDTRTASKKGSMAAMLGLPMNFPIPDPKNVPR